MNSESSKCPQTPRTPVAVATCYFQPRDLSPRKSSPKSGYTPAKSRFTRPYQPAIRPEISATNMATRVHRVCKWWEALWQAKENTKPRGLTTRLPRSMACGATRTATAAERPFVLFRDSLHWADPDSLDLLDFVTRQLTDVALLPIAIHRSEEIHFRYFHRFRLFLTELARRIYRGADPHCQGPPSWPQLMAHRRTRSGVGC